MNIRNTRFLKPIYLAAVDLYDWLFPFIAVNLLWFVCSATLILLPPASAALFDVAGQSYDNHMPTPRTFFMAMRRWWWRSWGWAGGNLVLVAAVVIAFQFYRSQLPAGLGDAAATLIGVIVALLLVGQLFYWPYQVLHPQMSMTQALRNSIFTALGDLPFLLRHLLILLIVGIPGIVLIAPVMLVLPVFIALLLTYSLRHWLVGRGISDASLRED